MFVHLIRGDYSNDFSNSLIVMISSHVYETCMERGNVDVLDSLRIISDPVSR